MRRDGSQLQIKHLLKSDAFVSSQQLISQVRSTGVEEKSEKAYTLTTAAVVDDISCGEIGGTFTFITVGVMFSVF